MSSLGCITDEGSDAGCQTAFDLDFQLAGPGNNRLHADRKLVSAIGSDLARTSHFSRRWYVNDAIQAGTWNLFGVSQMSIRCI